MCLTHPSHCAHLLLLNPNSEQKVAIASFLSVQLAAKDNTSSKTRTLDTYFKEKQYGARVKNDHGVYLGGGDGAGDDVANARAHLCRNWPIR